MVKSLYRSKSGCIKANRGNRCEIGQYFFKNSPYASDNIVILVGLTGKIRGQAISP